MRGEVLHYDQAQGFGFLKGADGNSYGFRREDLRRDAVLAVGGSVEFQPRGGEAKDIFTIRAPIHHASVPSIVAAPATTAAAAPLPAPMTAAPAAAPVYRQPVEEHPHFGRAALADTHEDTGLWSYFWRGLTVNYVNFHGRARRKEYWGFCLFWTLSLMVLMGAALGFDQAAGNFDPGRNAPIATVVVALVMIAGTVLPFVALAVRRQHDIGLSGWFYLVVLIPSVGGLILLVFSLIPSQKHPNKWGPVPGGIPLYPQTFTPPAPGTSQ